MKGYCGIDCHQCPCFVATRENDDIKRMNTAIKWSKMFNETILPREINCHGCQSQDVQFKNCNTCKIKKLHTYKQSS
ncbi:MAG: DUF3795 domain-containing protein [Clostridia bacterium]|nr:DUF3795 domain-containing protein [Clostridia bacterium]